MESQIAQTSYFLAISFKNTMGSLSNFDSNLQNLYAKLVIRKVPNSTQADIRLRTPAADKLTGADLHSMMRVAEYFDFFRKGYKTTQREALDE